MIRTQPSSTYSAPDMGLNPVFVSSLLVTTGPGGSGLCPTLKSEATQLLTGNTEVPLRPAWIQSPYSFRHPTGHLLSHLATSQRRGKEADIGPGLGHKATIRLCLLCSQPLGYWEHFLTGPAEPDDGKKGSHFDTKLLRTQELA